MKKILALVLALAMVAICGAAFAADPTGSVSVSNAKAGQTYTLYKLFDAQSTGSAITYTLPEGKSLEGNAWFELNDNNFVVAKSGVSTDWAKDPKAIAWAKSFGTQVGEAKKAETDGATISWSNVPYGYYYIDSTLGAFIGVDTVNPNASIQDKNDKPSIDKNITAVTNGTVADDGDDAVAQVGDTITYEIVVNAKPGAENYVVTDTLDDGLTPPAASGVTVAGLTVTNDYTVAVSGQVITVTFTKTYLDTITSDTNITITYGAVLNENAVIGAEGNQNTVTLKWGHDPDNESNPVIVNTYTAKIGVVKHDGAGAALAGAQFALKNSGNKYYHLKDDGTVEWVDKVEDATKYTSQASDGKLDGEFTGLTNGAYALEETIVPAGYNKIPDTDESLHFTISGSDYTDTNLIQGTTVVNNAGTTLPSTGGIGTTIFYILGGVLIVAAAVILVARKKASN